MPMNLNILVTDATKSFLRCLLKPLLNWGAVCCLFLSLPLYAANYYLMEGGAREGYIKIDLELQPGLVADVLGDSWIISAKNLRDVDGIHSKYINLVIYELKRTDELGTELFLADADPGLAPIFKGTGGTFQIATGSVNVFFAQDLNQEGVQKFFEDFAITRYRKLGWGKNGYEVFVAPGLPALELADRLRILPLVAKAYPDLWTNSYKIQ